MAIPKGPMAALLAALLLAAGGALARRAAETQTEAVDTADLFEA